MLRTIRDLDVEGRRVLVRVDFNVPISDGVVTDDTRIRACLPTIRELIGRNAKVILISHLGRPQGTPEARYRVDPIVPALEKLIDRPVAKLDQCIGLGVEEHINSEMGPGDVVLLENVRFYHGEKDNDPEFARSLARVADCFVNDAFGTAHRAHASTYGVTEFLPAAAGYLLAKELTNLDRYMRNPIRPYWVIVGGAKLSDKIGVLKHLMDKVDGILVGGGAAFPFLYAQGHQIGNSILDRTILDDIPHLLELSKKSNVELVLPKDVIAASELKPHVSTKQVSAHKIPQELMGLDLGAESVEMFKSKIREAQSLLWAGPLGAFEVPPFQEGSFEICHQISAATDTRTLIGGGDTVSCFKSSGSTITPNIYLSTGGGALLEYMSGKELPAIEALRV